MKTIEQRAEEWGEYIAERTPYDVVAAKYSYIAGANAQKEIDDAELLKLKAKWEINHDMKSIKERAIEYAKGRWNELTAKEAYIAGATDQKAIDEEVTITKYDAMTEKQLDREECFTSWYFQNAKGAPTFSDAIEWARKQTIDEVCNWLGNYLVVEHEVLTKAGCESVINELRKVMEE